MVAFGESASGQEEGRSAGAPRALNRVVLWRRGMVGEWESAGGREERGRGRLREWGLVEWRRSLGEELAVGLD